MEAEKGQRILLIKKAAAILASAQQNLVHSRATLTQRLYEVKIAQDAIKRMQDRLEIAKRAASHAKMVFFESKRLVEDAEKPLSTPNELDRYYDGRYTPEVIVKLLEGDVLDVAKLMFKDEHL